MKLSKRQKRIIKLLNEIGYFFGIVPYYDSKTIYHLWKQSGLSFEDVAEYFCKSPERARQYCYGQMCSNKLKIQIASYFREVIYETHN